MYDGAARFVPLLLWASVFPLAPLYAPGHSGGQDPPEPPKRTSLSDATLRSEVPKKPYAILRRAGVEAVVVNNEAVDDAVLPRHRAGYSGVASLTGAGRKDNLFVPGVAGLN